MICRRCPSYDLKEETVGDATNRFILSLTPFANNSIILELDRKTHRHQVNIPPRELIHTNFLHPTPSYGAGKLRILALEGTPSLSTINNMYQPVPKRETI